MRGARLTGMLWLVVVVCAVFVPAATAAGGPANWMYEPTSFTEVHLTLPQASIAELEAEPKEYVQGTFSLAETDGTPGSAGPLSAPLTVGIELKGNLGSLRAFGEKAAFKIKFDKYVEGQSFLGLEKMTLNNMVQDPSMIHETVTYQAFHDMGVPAPHTGFTYLTVNGKSYGVHLNIETQDAQAMENAYGTPFTSPPEHLYAGEYGADASNEPWHGTSEKAWEALEVSEGKKKEKGDLEALVAAIEASTPSFSQRVAAVADLTEMTKDWLVEKYVGHWDGYAGIPADYYRPNNYYLYSDAAGVFRLTPWGTDQTWQSNQHLDFANGGGILFRDCIADAAGCRQQYLAAGREALTALSAPSLDAVARCAAAELEPWQELEATTSEQQKLPNPGVNGAENLRLAEAEVVKTRAFIETRPAELASYLGQPAPTGGGEVPCPALRPVGGFPEPPHETTEEPGAQPTDETTGESAEEPPTQGGAPGVNGAGSSSGAVASAGPAPAPLKIDGRGIGAKGIVVDLEVPGPGRVEVDGKYARPARSACEGQAVAAGSGTVRVTCRLDGRFAKLLRSRWRRLRLDVHFVASDGAAEGVQHWIRLRRR